MPSRSESSPRSRRSPSNRSELPLRPSERGQPSRAFSGDQGFQTQAHEQGFLLDSGQLGRFPQNGIVNVARCLMGINMRDPYMQVKMKPLAPAASSMPEESGLLDSMSYLTYIDSGWNRWASRWFGCMARSRRPRSRNPQESRLDSCCDDYRKGSRWLCHGLARWCLLDRVATNCASPMKKRIGGLCIELIAMRLLSLKYFERRRRERLSK